MHKLFQLKEKHKRGIFETFYKQFFGQLSRTKVIKYSRVDDNHSKKEVDTGLYGAQEIAILLVHVTCSPYKML